MANTLHKLRMLIPRPIRDDDRFVALLQAENLNGCELELLRWPVMAITPADAPEQLKGRLTADIAASDLVIFVSVAAVEAALELLQGQASSLNRCRVFAVGKTTAESLHKAGIAVEFPDIPTSEGLLDTLKAEQVSNRQVLICRGKGGREKLAEALRARGAEVVYCELYERTVERRFADKIDQTILAGGVDIIAVHSGAIFDNLLSLLSSTAIERVKELPILVPGARVADWVKKAGCVTIIQAESALPNSMVARLLDWYTAKA